MAQTERKDERLIAVIVDLISKSGKSDAELELELGFSTQRINNYRLGKREAKLDFIAKWKDVYNVDIVDLYRGIETIVSHGKTEKGTAATNSDEAAVNKAKYLAELEAEVSLLRIVTTQQSETILNLSRSAVSN
jgi:transcriptional regulator with XRE-family HTH domain